MGFGVQERSLAEVGKVWGFRHHSSYCFVEDLYTSIQYTSRSSLLNIRHGIVIERERVQQCLRVEQGFVKARIWSQVRKVYDIPDRRGTANLRLRLKSDLG